MTDELSLTEDKKNLKIMEREFYSHQPVMKNEVLKFLITDFSGFYLDATLGLGGHSFDILNSLSAQGKLLGLDMDSEAIEIAQEKLSRFENRFISQCVNFKNLEPVANKLGFFPLSGALFDLGVSSLQLDNPSKGFSFNYEGPLDMRFSKETPLTAAMMINRWPEEQIARILLEFGEERFAKKIAQAIVLRRDKKPFETTTDLADLIAKVIPREKKHSATRSFMALRIAVNGEIDNIKPGLESAVSLLKVGGRLLVIAFHSIEDRLVQQLCDSFAERGLCKFIGKKSLKPSKEEIESNARARSARLHIMEKINEK